MCRSLERQIKWNGMSIVYSLIRSIIKQWKSYFWEEREWDSDRDREWVNAKTQK